MDGGAAKPICLPRWSREREWAFRERERERDRQTERWRDRNPNSVRNRTEKLSYTQTEVKRITNRKAKKERLGEWQTDKDSGLGRIY